MGEHGSNGQMRLGEAIDAARQCLRSLAGKQPEGVTAANRTEDGGWMVAFDVLELSRIPPSTDVLATYEVTLDGDGELVELERVRRFTRNQASED